MTFPFVLIVGMLLEVISNDLEVMGDSRLCEGNADNCRVEISDRGYFIDRNDANGWNELVTNTGLKMTGGGRLKVNGTADFYQHLTMRNVNAVLTASRSGTINAAHSPPEFSLIGINNNMGGHDSRAIYVAPRNQYNTSPGGTGRRAQRIYFGGPRGGNHDRSVRIELQNGALYAPEVHVDELHASKFVDADDPTFEVDPNQTSRIQNLDVNGNLHVNGVMTIQNSQDPAAHIADFFPNYVLKSVVWVVHRTRVRKPTCLPTQTAKIIIVPARAGFMLNHPSRRVSNIYVTSLAFTSWVNRGTWIVSINNNSPGAWTRPNIPVRNRRSRNAIL